ncbi:hypothetical protein BO78DRAFT_419534 [Aspergillus sclerotiicarbonarius CBS 121057]|uniref:Transferase family protein n=1 Tax=Aspergillus sclerotiicarbonarius (strain CBS 121057 / IBT 28362) TaxID=1448318 RepID=A0A319E818_ASPSB|nr:hypothetical protein BO78DRAFT_419534 [Aspergillus sclerotiicarbonarius CBS 121057]
MSAAALSRSPHDIRSSVPWITWCFHPYLSILSLSTGSKPTSNASTDDSVLVELESLRAALALVLDYYPHLTGRLHFDSNSHTPEIVGLGTGAELLTAHCSLRLDDIKSKSGRILMTSLPGSGSSLLPAFDPTIEGVCRDPILAMQHTCFACGSVALGIRIHHIVCDACGFFQFVRDLAQLYRGLRSSRQNGDDAQKPTLTSPPEIRSYLRDPDTMASEERQAALEYTPSVFYLDERPVPAPKSQASPSTDQLAPPPVLGRVLRFSGQKLQELNARATDPSGHDWVSSNDALVSYLYQLTYRARLQYLTSLGIPTSAAITQLSTGVLSFINMRGPTRLNFSPRYFPNLVYGSYMYLSHELLADGPLWKVTKAVHNMIHAVTPEQMKQTVRWLAVQPDKSRIKMAFDINGSFTASQWSKFDIYVGVDFDVDRQTGR